MFEYTQKMAAMTSIVLICSFFSAQAMARSTATDTKIIGVNVHANGAVDIKVDASAYDGTGAPSCSTNTTQEAIYIADPVDLSHEATQLLYSQAISAYLNNRTVTVFGNTSNSCANSNSGRELIGNISFE